MESLIKAGAMDNFGNRAKLLIEYPEITDKSAKKKKEASSGQTSLFGDELDAPSKSSTYEADDFSKNEKLAFEKEFLGFYLTAHPQFDNLINVKEQVSHELEAIEEERTMSNISIGGIVETIRKIFTKKSNSEMAFITIANEKGTSVECVVFPKVFDQYKNLLVKENVIIVVGKIDTKNDKPVILVEKIRELVNFSTK